MSTLAEQFTRTGEAILDLAAILPADLHVLSFGRPYQPDCDVELHVRGFDAALALLPVLGGVWKHSIHPHEPGAGQIHHRWMGTVHGADVSIVAIWDGRELFVEDIVPMVATLPEVHHWETPDDRRWLEHERIDHEVTDERAAEACDLAHRLELVGAL